MPDKAKKWSCLPEEWSGTAEQDQKMDLFLFG